MLFQSGPAITAFTSFVTHAWPWPIGAPGWLLSAQSGVTHDTFGRLPRCGGRVEARERLLGDGALVVLADVGEVRQRVPHPRRAAALEPGVALDRAREAVGRRALLRVRGPRDPVLVEEVREVGPAVERPVRVVAKRRRGPAVPRGEIRRAGARAVRVAALRRPAGDEPEMRRQAPAPVRLEHVVLEDEAPRVGPVVRDLAPVVVAHDVRVAEVGARRAVRMAAAPADERPVGDPDEAVHPAAVHVQLAGERAVRAARVVGAVPVEERLHALADAVRHAHRRHAVPHRDPVGVRIGAEEGVEGAVLLHDHDHVLDLVDAVRAGDGGLARRAPRRRNPRARRRPAGAVRRRRVRQLNGG